MENLTATFQQTEAAAAASVGLVIEQEKLPEYLQSANLADIAAMVARARSGLSAFTYRRDDCPLTFDGDLMLVPMTLYVWPTSLDLPWSMEVKAGKEIDGITFSLGTPGRINLEHEGNVVVPMTDTVDMGWLIDLHSATWATPCYNALGQIIPSPSITVDGTRLKMSSTCFGVIRLKAAAMGYQVICTMTVDRPSAGSINEITAWVVASYDAGQVKKDLVIPQCVLDYLTECPDGIPIIQHNEAGYPKNEIVPVVYYSTCTGKPREIRYE